MTKGKAIDKLVREWILEATIGGGRDGRYVRQDVVRAMLSRGWQKQMIVDQWMLVAQGKKTAGDAMDLLTHGKTGGI